MSDHSVDVVPVSLTKHPNADALSLVHIGGYQVVVRTEDWAGKQIGAFIPPDSLVDTSREEFSFLDGHPRITARRFRGEWSYGLLVPAPVGASLGDNVAKALGVTHYEPQIQIKTASASSGRNPIDIFKGPQIQGPYYDIENWQKHPGVFEEGEQVYVTEKIHGSQIRLTYQRGKFYVASRKHWRKEYWTLKPKNIRDWFKTMWNKIRRQERKWFNDSFYWKAFKANEELMNYIRGAEGTVFYGEVYGAVQKGFNYDTTPENPLKIRLFDAYIEDDDFGFCGFLDSDTFTNLLPEHLRVPVAYIGSYNAEVIRKQAEISSMLTRAHVREGVVIKPAHEKFQHNLGRKILKAVNPNYLAGEH